MIILNYNLENPNTAHGRIIIILILPQTFFSRSLQLLSFDWWTKVSSNWLHSTKSDEQYYRYQGRSLLRGKYTKCNALTNGHLSYYLQAHKNQDSKSNCFQNEECISFNKTKYYEPNRSLFAVRVVLKTCPDFSKPLPFGKNEKRVYTGLLKSCCQ